MSNCIFCSIAERKQSAEIVFEDKDFIAFLDKSPIFKGHTLLVPKKHIQTILDFPDNELMKMITDVKLLSIAIKSALECDGILLINNNIISQSVPHFHMHIIPRIKGEVLKGFMWPRTRYKDNEYEEFGKKIAVAVKSLEESI